MIKKATLISENKKLRRGVFIWKNIGIGMNSTVKEKEIAAKQFLELNPSYTLIRKIFGLIDGTGSIEYWKAPEGLEPEKYHR